MCIRSIGAVVLLMTIGVGIGDVCADPVSIEPLSKEWATLAMITGLHSVVGGKSGFALRVLEADGSNSVAENPVSVFVVATNQGTSDLQEHVWRLPEGVIRVKKVVASKCGLDIAADVVAADQKQRVQGKKSVELKACFFDEKGMLGSHLYLTEKDAGRAATPSEPGLPKGKER